MIVVSAILSRLREVLTRSVLLASLFAWALLMVGCAPRVPETSRDAAAEIRPNIVFILTDDQGPWAMSAARGSHPQVSTPNIDRIAREGAYLPNSFVSTPVCSPSRAELMTSRYGSELGITDWIDPQREPGLGLPAEPITWPEVIRQAGYSTGLVGKWHLGDQPRFHPTTAGYRYFMGFLGGGTTPRDPVLETGGIERKISGFTVEILTDSAVGFIRRHRSEPCVLSVHYRSPHKAWLPLPQEDWAPYRAPDPMIPDPAYPHLDVARVKRDMREYLGSVASVDRNVGRILQALDEMGLADNTVVILTSDHGYNIGHHAIWSKGNALWMLTELPPGTLNVPAGQRPNLFDTSLRVPTAIRWPARIPPGTVVEEVVTNLDWYPTLSMAGIEVPPDALIRGRDFLPLLLGQADPRWDNGFYAEYSTHHSSRTHMRAYRTPEWKLVRDYLNPERDELYHLAVDPGETTNLIGSADPAVETVVQEFDRRMRQRLQEIGDPVLRLAEARDLKD